jgi:histidinol dehydrogenase
MRLLEGNPATRRVHELSRRGERISLAEGRVRPIVRDVRRSGDAALRKYARRWDGLPNGKCLRVPPEEMQAAWNGLAVDARAALKNAAASIRQFCRWQMPREWSRSKDGIRLAQVIRPLHSVGCYVPGGRYPLPSTLLMTVIPAQVAGVREIRVVSPNPQPATLAVAALLGVREFYRVGGAQAIAALAYGTESVPRVQKIVGPGNSFVTAAKKLVAFDCSIDMLAGPTECVILLQSGNATFIAADLVAQAEHDPEALSVFITTSRELALAVAQQTTRIAATNAIARVAWNKHGSVLLAASHAEAIEWANRIAPEHITVTSKDLGAVQSAGSIFIGDYSAQSAGDYASGPNHVLPTGSSASFRGGLSVLDFIKVITVQELSANGARRLSPTVVQLAELEGLHAHAQSMLMRCGHA